MADKVLSPQGEVVFSPFVPRKHSLRLDTTKFDTEYDNPHVYKKVIVVHEKSSEYPEGVYSIQPDVKHDKTNIHDYINSFEPETGVYNIMKKVIMTGDTSLLGVDESGAVQPVVDSTIFPDNPHDVQKSVLKGMSAFRNAPDELTKGKSFSQFAQEITADEAKSFIQAIAAKIADSSKDKEDKK